MSKVKIAIIGLGGVGQVIHLPILSKMSNVEISAIAEINKSRLESVAEKYNIIHRFTDYKEMLDKVHIDAVIIATPTSTHKDIAIDCLKAHKDILVEKPVARTYKEAKAIFDAAQNNKRNIMVGMNLRFRPDAMLLKSLINSGEIGDPFYIRCGWMRKQSSSSNWINKKEESGGGVIIDLGILLLDMSLWLFDYPPVDTVSTQNFYHDSKTVEDSSISFIRNSDSSIINLETSWTAHSEIESFYLSVFGTKGSARLNPFKIYKRVEDQFVDLTPSLHDNPQNLFKKSYTNELKHFIGAVRGLHPFSSTGENALSRMKVIEAMYKSAQKNSEIKIKI